jgi:hypothetical protein
MFYAAGYGFATAGTNNGHFGNTGVFFYNNSEVIEDFAYRALHTGVIVGKELTRTSILRAMRSAIILDALLEAVKVGSPCRDFPMILTASSLALLPSTSEI